MGQIFKKYLGTIVKLGGFVTLTLLLLPVVYYSEELMKYTHSFFNPIAFSGCCVYPCKNGGICMTTGKNNYTCECLGNYYGRNCDKISAIEVARQWYRFILNSIEEYFAWKLPNNSPLIAKKLLNSHLHELVEDINAGSYQWSICSEYMNIHWNERLNNAVRTLPPVPSTCPTAMGIKGPSQLPSPDHIFKSILQRKSFISCPQGTNILFPVYIQHFLSQFEQGVWFYVDKRDRTDTSFDMSHVYGKSKQVRDALRSFKKGKLKSRSYKGEEYPPYLHDCPQLHLSSTITSQQRPRWAIGNPNLGNHPLLFPLSVILLREHNRVCDVLHKMNLDWSDEELFQSAKLIVTGELLQITMKEYLKHFMQLPLNLLRTPGHSKLRTDYRTVVHSEFTATPYWHSFMPNEIEIENVTYNINEINSNIVFVHGLEVVVNAMTGNSAGKAQWGNVGNIARNEITDVISRSRIAKLQSFNNYRRKFKLKPYESFEEFSTNLHVSEALNDYYLDIEALELPVGLLCERQNDGVVPPSMALMGGTWLLNILLSHPLNSQNWWTSKTFGGKIGMNIIKKATLRKLFCSNVKDKCRNVHIAFVVPNKSDGV